MNDNKENENGIYVDTNEFGQYYRPLPRKPPTGTILVVFILLAVIFLIMWFSGLLTPKDSEAEYQKLVDSVCTAAVKYTEDPNYYSKLSGIDIPGKVIYIKVRDLANANLMGVVLQDPRTNDKIPLTTDIKLSVITAYHTLCEGFAWAADDRIIPIVHLNGDATININVGGVLTDHGAYATDNRDGDITDKIVKSGTVDLTKAGTYEIKYYVQDRAGNLSASVTRTIIVK